MLRRECCGPAQRSVGGWSHTRHARGKLYRRQKAANDHLTGCTSIMLGSRTYLGGHVTSHGWVVALRVRLPEFRRGSVLSIDMRRGLRGSFRPRSVRATVLQTARQALTRIDACTVVNAWALARRRSFNMTPDGQERTCNANSYSGLSLRPRGRATPRGSVAVSRPGAGARDVANPAGHILRRDSRRAGGRRSRR